VVTVARARGCGPCGVSSLTLSVIAIAASTQPNTMILSVVIALGPSGLGVGNRVQTNRWGAVTNVTRHAWLSGALGSDEWRASQREALVNVDMIIALDIA
jgi:hypothetical protein